MSSRMKQYGGAIIAIGVSTLSGLLIFQIALANNVTSKVTVQSSVPSITGLTLNNGSAINLTANATTSISVNATITDYNGCADLTNGTATILVYRDAVTSSSCLTGTGSAVTNLNCYTATVFTATSSCVASDQINVTTTFGIYYFAQATDGSSQFSGKGWRATINVATAGNTTGTADSASTTLNTLTALQLTTTTINYGVLQANANTGSGDQVTTSTNAGNSSTTLQLSANQTLTSGSTSIATSSQVYATTTFTYPGATIQLTGTAASVSGYLLTAPTSTTNIAQPVFWGLGVPAGTPSGTYSGTDVFTAVFAN